ncbi:MAG: hypothetical protein H0V66_10415, partial [Bdellovibrionales bacterium]|nr:hypothetical protein [Bdellovibrionales bacterium]
KLTAKAANQKFSIQAVSKIVQTVLQKDSLPFAGFTPLFYQASLANQLNSPADPMFLTEQLTLNKLYKDIYSSYVRNI